MNYDQAIETVKGWPEDRSVPRRLASGIKSAPDEDVFFMRQLIEVLLTAAVKEEDYKLIDKYFG